MFSKRTIYILLQILVTLIVIKATKGLEINNGNNGMLLNISSFNESNLIENKQKTPASTNTFNSCNQTSEDDDNPLEDLPKDLFTVEQWRNGAIIFHLMGAIYFFTLLGVVCNDYFLPAVECICIDLHISKHVAAATFMATATTMPEFFTNTINTLITESDMGVGTIIGSLMFNTLGVAALSGVAIRKSVQLDWWPVTRDCVFYSFNTIFLIIIAWGGTITFIESLIMVILCLTYYVIMFMQNKFMGVIRRLVEDKLNCCASTRYDLTQPPENSAKAKLPLGKDPNPNGSIYFIRQVTISSISGNSISTIASSHELIHKEKELEDNTQFGRIQKQFRKLITIPDGKLKKFWFFYSWPIRALLTCIIPSPKAHKKLYPLTFIMCIALIGINSYMIVWMITVIGYTLKIPDIVMGMTFLAAGATTPEALSSLISIRKGESGIGVSNALGANSLAILLSLGVPWFIRNAMHYNDKDGNNVIHINSQGIEYTIGILLLSTVSLYIIMSIAGFRLRRTVGVALFMTYFVYITLQILMEMNIFFPRKGAEC